MQVRLHLLTAVLKCFFRRPPETQKALGAALAAGLADSHQVWLDLYFFLMVNLICILIVKNRKHVKISDLYVNLLLRYYLLQDVHDRALFYYRLLQYDVSLAERVVDPPKQAVSVFADTQSSEIKDRIFDEFNSLSILYQKVIICYDSFIMQI